MPIRLKVIRRKEQQISKVKGLMEMYSININPSSNPDNQQLGGSSFAVTAKMPAIDPKIQKTRDLFQMFHLAR